MRINQTTFGEITIDGKTYDHGVIVRLSGEIVKRKSCRIHVRDEKEKQIFVMPVTAQGVSHNRALRISQ